MSRDFFQLYILSFIMSFIGLFIMFVYGEKNSKKLFNLILKKFEEHHD